MFVPANGISIYTETSGPPNGPVVLLISGTGNDLRADVGPDGIKPEHPLAAAGFRVIQYDQRGLGQTTKPDEPYSMAGFADDAAALVNALIHTEQIPTETVHVIGISFGGMVAQNLVIRHPNLIDRLVLCCTSTGGEGGSSFDLLSVADLPDDERLRIVASKMDTRNDLTTTPPTFAPGYLLMAKRGARSHALMTMDPLGTMGARRQLEARGGHDTWAGMAEVATHTLVCGGVFDATAPPENLRALANRIPNARLAMFEGGHAFLFQDHNAWPTIVTFLRESS
jgi:3-oxoadipate enol-lactonase